MRTLYGIIHSCAVFFSLVHFSLRFVLIPFQFDWMCVFVRRLIFGIYQFSRGFYSFSFVSFCCFFILICIFIVCCVFFHIIFFYPVWISVPVRIIFSLFLSILLGIRFLLQHSYFGWGKIKTFGTKHRKNGFYCHWTEWRWWENMFRKWKTHWFFRHILLKIEQCFCVNALVHLISPSQNMIE